MTNVGVIGLGIMGLPMAVNLVRAGFDVTGYNRSPARTQLLKDQGGTAANSIAAAAYNADVVITVLPDTPDVEQVVLGIGGVLEHLRPGATLIDMSTIRPAASRQIAQAAGECGIDALDAPVSGGEQGAINASLSIMVGGTPATFEAAQPVLRAMGSTVVHVGPHGAGQSVKAANQMIVAATIGVVGEAITLLEALNVDTDAAIQVLSGGLAQSAVLDKKARSICERNFTPGFRIALHHKDLGIALSAARDAGVVTPLASLVGQEMASMVAQGDGGLDHAGLVQLVRQLSGRR